MLFGTGRGREKLGGLIFSGRATEPREGAQNIRVLAAHIFPETPLRRTNFFFLRLFSPILATANFFTHTPSRMKLAKKNTRALPLNPLRAVRVARARSPRARIRAGHVCACVLHVGKEFPRGSIVIAGALSRLKTSLQEQRKSEALLQLSPSASGTPPLSPTARLARPTRLSLKVPRRERETPSLPPFIPFPLPPCTSPLDPRIWFFRGRRALRSLFARAR